MNFKEALIAHPYARILRWIAGGERIQHNGRDGWRDCENGSLLLMIANGSADSPSTFRIAPRTITVNGVEVPAPESDAPCYGDTYFIPAAHCNSLCTQEIWENEDFYKRVLERGLVYLNKEDAIARAKAMLLHK